jgi:hypothetical protein
MYSTLDKPQPLNLPHTAKFFEVVMATTFNADQHKKYYCLARVEIELMIKDPFLSLVHFNHLLDYMADNLSACTEELMGKNYYDWASSRIQYLQRFSAWSLNELYFREGVWLN